MVILALVLSLTFPCAAIAMQQKTKGQRLCDQIPSFRWMNQMCKTTGIGAFIDDPFYVKKLKRLRGKK